MDVSLFFDGTPLKALVEPQKTLECSISVFSSICQAKKRTAYFAVTWSLGDADATATCGILCANIINKNFLRPAVPGGGHTQEWSPI